MSAPKTNKADEHASKGKEKEKGPTSGGGLKTKLLMGAFVSTVVVAETFFFFFLVPSGEEVAALAEARLIANAQEIDAKKEKSSDEGNKIIEFELGTYGVPFAPADSDQTYRVEFRLFGTLHAKDREHLQKIFDERKGRFRHRLMLEIRNTTMQELKENQLGLIQRRILATSTELLGEAILLSVGFEDYQVLEE